MKKCARIGWFACCPEIKPHRGLEKKNQAEQITLLRLAFGGENREVNSINTIIAELLAVIGVQVIVAVVP